MVATILGIQDIDFATDEGVHVEGRNLYLAFNNRYVIGKKTNKFFVGSKFKDIFPELIVDQEISIDFNENGKIDNIDIL